MSRRTRGGSAPGVGRARRTAMTAASARRRRTSRVLGETRGAREVIRARRGAGTGHDSQPRREAAAIRHDGRARVGDGGEAALPKARGAAGGVSARLGWRGIGAERCRKTACSRGFGSEEVIRMPPDLERGPPASRSRRLEIPGPRRIRVLPNPPRTFKRAPWPDRGIAQLVERRSPKPNVAGSNPVAPARPSAVAARGGGHELRR